MRRPLVAGNWKLNGSRAANGALLRALVSGCRDDAGREIVVCPPFVYLPDAAALLGGSTIGLGAQDAAAESAGAFTGEISAAMLADVGCRYVIVGHSERRALYGECDDMVARKFAAVLAAGLVPILCVGETLEERERDQTEAVVERQLRAVLGRVAASAWQGAVVAYEPVWAIGTGRTATPQQAQAVHAFIRGQFATLDARMAGQLRILYGGSVKGANAAALFGMPDIDGGLVGGASLDAQDFILICDAASGSAT
ncbi:MAG: triose-phosphate isomerase [Gammaproteobacteria bacterium]|nr:triose-phosphate isomerase [Gammaproteobacteria bacterium]